MNETSRERRTRARRVIPCFLYSTGSIVVFKLFYITRNNSFYDTELSIYLTLLRTGQRSV